MRRSVLDAGCMQQTQLKRAQTKAKPSVNKREQRPKRNAACCEALSDRIATTHTRAGRRTVLASLHGDGTEESGNPNTSGT